MPAADHADLLGLAALTPLSTGFLPLPSYITERAPMMAATTSSSIPSSTAGAGAGTGAGSAFTSASAAFAFAAASACAAASAGPCRGHLMCCCRAAGI